jgi:hypothetical protein
MKKYIILFLWIFSFGNMSGQANDTVSHEITLAEDKHLKIILIHVGSADLGDPAWLKLKIVNNSRDAIRITDANYAINREEETNSGEKYINHGSFGRGNQFELFHYYYDLDNPSDHRSGVQINAGDSLISWTYLTNYASVLLDGHYGNSIVCAIAEIAIVYDLNGKEREIKSNETEFCFFWTDSENVPVEKLVARITQIIFHPHYAWVDSYVVDHLMKMSIVAGAIPTDDLIQGILLRKDVQYYSESCHFLEELSKRNALPNQVLTKHYKEKLSNQVRGLDRELLYYWDNALLQDVLASALSYRDVCSMLEVNAEYWSTDVENKRSVYIYLAQKLHFSDTFQISQDHFKEWAEMIKTLTISRDKSFLSSLIPLLENETAYAVEDWSRFRYAGMLRKEDKPDIIQVRVCDVAFVALLRGLDQFEFKMIPGVSFYVSQHIKTEILDQETINNFTRADIHAHNTLHHYEKVFILTPEWKATLQRKVREMN